MVIYIVRKQSMLERQALGDANKAAFKRAMESHDRHMRSVDEVTWIVDKMGIRYRVTTDIAGYALHKDALVVTVGGDGTLLWTSHWVGKDIPLLGINSDPTLSRGVLCQATVKTAAKAIQVGLERKSITKATRMAVHIDGKLARDRVLNEALFCHECPASMTRFVLPRIDRSERVCCSGIWIGTGTGSTGAITSAGGCRLEVTSEHLEAVVRERYGGHSDVYLGTDFRLVSKINDGRLYFDGSRDMLAVGYERRIDFKVSREPLSLVTVKSH